jgi:site-specific DNA-methyltransferase (adenine-specific)
MSNRLLEIRRVMKDTASVYLHCDPTASHYLKLVMDGVFGVKNYRNEISWKRSQPKSHTSVNFSRSRDIIFRYSKTDSIVFNKVYAEYDPSYLKKFYRFKDKDGRVYRLGDLTNPNKNRPNLTYEFLGITRVWRWTKERMQKAYDEGRIIQSKPENVPRYKRYLDEMHGQPVTDNWDDIEHLHGSNAETLGYPTQKPQALLERIIKASSNEGDVIFDPFCGCGTSIHAAEALNRSWIGIDITHLAIALIKKRLADAFGELPTETHGLPTSYAGAMALARQDKHQFELWVVGLINAQPYMGGRKGADTGIDGYLRYNYLETGNGKQKIEQGTAIIEVKGGQTGVKDIRNLGEVVSREEADQGILISAVKPTRKMLEHADGKGVIKLGVREYPVMQVIWLKDLMHGTAQVKYPESGWIDHTKTAPREKGINQTKLDD